MKVVISVYPGRWSYTGAQRKDHAEQLPWVGGIGRSTDCGSEADCVCRGLGLGGREGFLEEEGEGGRGGQITGQLTSFCMSSA